MAENCPVEGCSLSTEEEHRLVRGYVAENAALRAKLRQPETVDLSTVSNEELIKELSSRLA